MNTEKTVATRDEGRLESVKQRPAVAPAVDVFENREEVLLVADLPGVTQDNLRVDLEDISDINPNMYWNSGRRILAAAKIAQHFDNLHPLYITNFKCGPDSYIKSFLDAAAGKPSLILQFDGHSNDAGFITRCEAYLDSKGFLRCHSSATVM